MAEYIANHLFTDEANITSLAAENRKGASAILRFLDNLLAKLGNTNAQERIFIERARSLYTKALHETSATTGETVKDASGAEAKMEHKAEQSAKAADNPSDSASHLSSDSEGEQETAKGELRYERTTEFESHEKTKTESPKPETAGGEKDIESTLRKTLRAEITENTELMQMLNDKFGASGMTELALQIEAEVRKTGTVGKFGMLFSDGGRAVEEALAVGGANSSIGAAEEEGRQYSIKRTKEIPYSKQIDAYYGKRGILKRDDDIFVMTPGEKLEKIGLGNKPIFMLKSNLNKSTREAQVGKSKSAHGIPEHIIRNLQTHIKDAAFAIMQNGRISLISNEKVKTQKEENAPLLIGIDPKSSVDGKPANEIKSIYGRDNFIEWIYRMADNNAVTVLNEKKAEALLRDVEESYSQPVAYADDLTEFILTHANKIVNTSGENIQYAITKDGEETGDMEAESEVPAYSLDFWDEWLEKIRKYGAMEKGEKPARELEVPKKVADDKPVSQTVRTVLEARVTPDEALPTLEQMVLDGDFSYTVHTDKQAIKNANGRIEKSGYATAFGDWMRDVEAGKVSKESTALGWALYNQAATSGDMKTAITILNKMVQHQRSAAQALQATRILKQLSPEGQLYQTVNSVEALGQELRERYGEKAPDLKVDEGLAEEFLKARTQKERDGIKKKIYRDVGRQMPSRFIDKWNAWRYLAMLGNPRTHVRNILGNAFFAPVVLTKNLTATAIESAVHRISGGKTGRSKAVLTGNRLDRALLRAAWADYENVAELISSGGKYNDAANANQSIEDGKRVFKFAPIETARKGNSKLLELEDVWFSKPHYALALAQCCKANVISPKSIEDGKNLDVARAYAVKEAQKATYKDTNAFSQMVSGWGRTHSAGDTKVKKAFNTAVEGILPFRKTPANILVRGLEYSPLGLLKGLSVDLVKVKNGKMTAAEAIDNISAGLTGTGLLAFGVLLAAEGLIRGHGGDDEDENRFEEMMGHQAYALELSDGKSITLDWLAPEALPFFVGVNLWEMTKGEGEAANLSAILTSVGNVTEPMLEMSCLQSLNDLFDSIGYASSEGLDALPTILASAATSYLTQALPTLLGQAERTGEKNRMTTYSEKSSFLTGDMQYTLGKASAKIPGWDYGQIPYIDAWGRKEETGNTGGRIVNNFLNPAYTSTVKESKMEKELLRLYEKTGEKSVFPQRADKYFTVDEKRKDLTAEEYVRYATLKGEKSHKAVTSLVNSSAYKKLSDAEKVKAIADAYDYANQKAKKAVSASYKTENWTSTADEFGTNVGSFLAYRAEVSSTRKENGDKISKQQVAGIVLDMAQNGSDAWKMYLSTYEESDGTKHARDNGVDGKTYMHFLEALKNVDEPTKSGKYGTYTQDEAREAVELLEGLSYEEKAALWQSVNTTWKKNPYI